MARRNRFPAPRRRLPSCAATKSGRCIKLWQACQSNVTTFPASTSADLRSGSKCRLNGRYRARTAVNAAFNDPAVNTIEIIFLDNENNFLLLKIAFDKIMGRNASEQKSKPSLRHAALITLTELTIHSFCKM